MGRGSVWAVGIGAVVAAAAGVVLSTVLSVSDRAPNGGVGGSGIAVAGGRDDLTAGASDPSNSDGEAPPMPLVELDPGSPVGRIILAQIAAVRAQPRSAPAWYRLGLAYQASNDAALARECLERAARLEPTAPRPHYHLAMLAHHAGDLDGAIDSLRRVVEHAPTYAPAHVRLGEWHLERDEIDDAERAFLTARRVDATSTRAAVGLARIALCRERAGDAEAILAPLAAAGVVDPAVHRVRGIALRRLGRGEDAEATLARARRADPPIPDPWLAEIDAFRSDVRTRMEHAESLVRSGRAGQAIPILSALHRETPENTGILCNLAVAHRTAGEHDRSLALLEAELRRVPQSWQVHYTIALGRFIRLRSSDAAQPIDVGRLANIVPHVDAAIRLNPAHAPSLGLRGEIHEAVGDRTAAVEAYRRAAIADPENPQWLVRQGLAELADGRAERAAATLRRAVAAAPGDPTAMQALADALTACGQREEAMTLRRALERASPPGGMAPGGLVAEEWRR